MLVNPPHSDNLSAIKTSDGSAVSPNSAGGANPAGCTLAIATYVFSLGGEKLAGVAPLEGAQVQWDATFVGVFTIEVCQFAGKIGRPDETGPDDVKGYDAAAKGAWMKVDPSTAYVTVTSSDGTTGNATVVNATVTVAGGAAGGAYWDLGNLGARRVRIKVVVTTGGVVRCGMLAKAAG